MPKSSQPEVKTKAATTMTVPSQRNIHRMGIFYHRWWLYPLAMENIKKILLGAMKAIVAAVVTVSLPIVLQLVTDLGDEALIAITGAATTAAVYAVPNKQPE